MVATVTGYKVEGASGRLGASGEEQTLVYLVQGLSSSDRVHEALTASGVPSWGDAHPLTAGLYAEMIDARLLEPTKARVEARYTAFPDRRAALKAGIISSIQVWRSAIKSRIRNKDFAGNLMENNYSGRSWTLLLNTMQREITGPGTTYYWWLRERLDVPESGAVLQYTKYAPSVSAASIVGTVNRTNSSAWLGLAAGTWYCQDIQSEQDESGYFITYSLQYDPDGWLYESRIGAEENAMEPPDIALNNGIKLFQIYGSVDFNTAIGT